MIPPPLRDLHSSAVQRVLAGGPPRILGQTVQFPALRADGSEVLVDCLVNRTQDEPPLFTAWIRERDGDRAQAARRLAMLTAVEELAEIGSWEWLPDSDDLTWSDNMFRILGLEPGEMEPTMEWAFEHIHPDDVEKVRRRSDRLRASGQLAPVEYRFFRPDGSMRHLIASQAISEWGEDNPLRLVGWTRDVTERRRAERQIAAHVAVADALTLWSSLEEGASGLLAGLGHAMDCAVGVLWLPDGGELVARVLWHAENLHSRRFDAVTRRIRLSPGSDAPGRAWQGREPVVLARLDAAAGPRASAPAPRRACTARSPSRSSPPRRSSPSSSSSRARRSTSASTCCAR